MKTYLLPNENKKSNLNFSLSDKKELEIKTLKKNIVFDNLIVENINNLAELYKKIPKKILIKQNYIKKKNLILIIDNCDNESVFRFYIFNSSLFKNIIIIKKSLSLSIDEMIDITTDKNAGNFVIGLDINYELELITLIRGDISKLLIPFSAFPPTSNGINPDFKNISIEDYGQTIKLGEYESSVDAVLYEYDSKYRNKLNSYRTENEKFFGACLKRLRIQKRFRQNDFNGISEREIRRIEKGEVEPSKKNLELILKKLDVSSKDEILSY